MGKKPKGDYEFKLQTPDDRLDDLTAEVCSLLRGKAETPAEALAVLEMAFYMICKGQRAVIKNALADFASNVLILEATNDIQGSA